MSRHSEYKKRIRAERTAHGLCPECGERPPREGKYECQQCADNLKVRQKNRNIERKRQGLCVRCGGTRPCSCRSKKEG